MGTQKPPQLAAAVTAALLTAHVLRRALLMGPKEHSSPEVRIIHRALDAGINFIDTADVYSHGESEVIVGKALAGGRRDDVVLASKVHMPMGDDPNQRGNSRRWIIREVEDSLRRLATDWIDLYQIHRYDPDTDLDETLGALSELVRVGKVRYIGHSTWPASAIVEGQWTARERGRERFTCEQPTYSILTRGIEADVLPTCMRYGMGVISYSPLAGGWLSGRYRKDTEVQGPMSPARQRLANRFDMSLPENQRKLEATEQLAQLAGKAGVSLIQMAIAFVLRHPAVTATIIGPRTMEHLESRPTTAGPALPCRPRRAAAEAQALVDGDALTAFSSPGMAVTVSRRGSAVPAGRVPG